LPKKWPYAPIFFLFILTLWGINNDVNHEPDIVTVTLLDLSCSDKLVTGYYNSR
jgi:hypothetical protein